MNVKKDILWRVLLSVSALGLFACLVLYFIVRIQYVEGAHWKNLSDSLTVKMREIPSVRGSIYSEKGDLLATSIPIYKISLDFNVIHSRHSDSFMHYVPELARNLSQTFGNRSEADYRAVLRREFKRKNRYFLITRNASYIQAKELKTWPIFKHGRYRGGVIAEERTVRKKPYGSLMHRTIGFVNENGRGAGIEASFHETLAGVSGKGLVQRISGGYRPLNDEYTVEPENGKDVFTTLDVELQDIVHQALHKGMESNGAETGSAILMEVSTGKIKAMANFSRSEEGYSERFNHAVGTIFEPGSTIKLVSSLALLEKTDLKPSDTVDINYGKIKFYDRTIEDSDKGRYAKLSFQEIFEKSSNVGISKSVVENFKNKPEKFIETFDKLHLSEAIDVGIKGSGVPMLLRPESSDWSGTSLPSVSLGYSVGLTPLHLCMLYNSIANNGTMMKPMLIRGIGSLGALDKSYEPTVLEKRVCSQEHLLTLQSFLEGVVKRGTARNLNDLPFPVAGKTGTSRIANVKNGYGKHEYHASFAGYFPADNPKYTCYVVISKPSKGRYYGSSVAAPVFKEIARKVHARVVDRPLVQKELMEVPASLQGQWEDLKVITDELNYQLPKAKRKSSDWIALENENQSLRPSPIELTEELMPDLKGMGIRDVLYLMENRGYKVRFTGFGHVKKQSPPIGDALKEGQTIYVQLGR